MPSGDSLQIEERNPASNGLGVFDPYILWLHFIRLAEIGWPIQEVSNKPNMGRDPAGSEDSPPFQTILDALDDPDCRAILREITEPMTANELKNALDIPKSTLYRKLKLLGDAALVRERIEIHSEGGRTTRYQRDFDDVIIRIEDGDTFDVAISRPKRSVDERLANIWSKMGDEI